MKYKWLDCPFELGDTLYIADEFLGKPQVKRIVVKGVKIDYFQHRDVGFSPFDGQYHYNPERVFRTEQEAKDYHAQKLREVAERNISQL